MLLSLSIHIFFLINELHERIKREKIEAKKNCSTRDEIKGKKSQSLNSRTNCKPLIFHQHLIANDERNE